jgi:hypothetical protein
MSQAVSRPTTVPDIRQQEDVATEGLPAFRALRLVTRRNTNVKLVEPPSCSSASAIVFIGKNSRGNWVAQEQNGLYGGLFVNRAQAIKYALFENGHHPETIVETSREIELDMGGTLPSSDPTFIAATTPARRVA